MPDNPHDLNSSPELTGLASALSKLAPAAISINRDRLLYDAGLNAGKRSLVWLWPAGTTFFAALSLVLGGMLMFSNHQQATVIERERYVEVRVPVPSNEKPPPLTESRSPDLNEVKQTDSTVSPETVRLLQVRRDMLLFGPEMLPAEKPANKAPSFGDQANDLDHWLDVPRGTFTAPYQKSPRLFPNVIGDE